MLLFSLNAALEVFDTLMFRFENLNVNIEELPNSQIHLNNSEAFTSNFDSLLHLARGYRSSMTVEASAHMSHGFKRVIGDRLRAFDERLKQLSHELHSVKKFEEYLSIHDNIHHLLEPVQRTFKNPARGAVDELLNQVFRVESTRLSVSDILVFT